MEVTALAVAFGGCMWWLLFLCLNSWTADFSAFQKILDKYIIEKTAADGGFHTAFEYEKAFKSEDFSKWVSEQRAQLKDFNPETITEKNVAIAFWINSYNFFMIEKLFRSGTKKDKSLKINSVKDLGSFFNPYAVFTLEEFQIGGKKYSLDQMEKGILLGEEFKKKGWKDARIHFAVNCASVGCPPLIKKIYSAASLDQQMDDNTRLAMKTSRHLKVKGSSLHLTHLFKWYKADFTDEQGTIKKWISKYVSEEMNQKIQATKSISFIDYDWNLNRPSNF